MMAVLKKYKQTNNQISFDIMATQLQPYAIIKVIEPVLQQPPNENIPPFVTYQVCGIDPHGDFNIRRRFR